MGHHPGVPLTAVARRAANAFRDGPGLGAMLRARQIHRSNPALAAEIRAELTRPCRPGQGAPATNLSAHAEPPIHS